MVYYNNLAVYREIMEQYKDFWHRAHRLEPAHRAYLGGKPAPIHLVTNEDMCLYLNWMCWKFSSTEKINNYLMVCYNVINVKFPQFPHSLYFVFIMV